jgi:hypothetical protein
VFDSQEYSIHLFVFLHALLFFAFVCVCVSEELEVSFQSLMRMKKVKSNDDGPISVE